MNRNNGAIRATFKTAAVLAGMILIASAGAAAHAATGEAWATPAAMLIAAAMVATYGGAGAQWCWEMMMIGKADPYGAATAHYERTTRGAVLAPKLRRMARRDSASMTVIAVGTEHVADRHGRYRWDEALDEAASAGAKISLFILIGNADARARSLALASDYPNVECIELAEPADVWLVLAPIIAWTGDRDDPADALLWIETVRQNDNETTSVEFRNTANLRRNKAMLAEYDEPTHRVRAQAAKTASAATSNRTRPAQNG